MPAIWASSEEALSLMDSEELVLLLPEVLMNVETGHRLGCQCEGFNKLDGPQVTCGDLTRVMNELRRRRIGVLDGSA